MKSLCYVVSILSATWFASGFAAQAVSAAETKKPLNVVMIVGDDWGYTDFGFMGSKQVQTPRLDRLAAESLVFRRGYVPSSLCRPSLATLYSGLYPHQHKITSNDPPKPETLGLKGPAGAKEFQRQREEQIAHIDTMPTLPKLLGERGYLSFQTGKWWEGKYTRGGFTHGMTEGTRHGDAGLKIGRETMQPMYDFIDGALKDQKPFFVWYAPFMPHTPHTPPERLLKKYEPLAPTLAVAKYWAMCEWCDETCGQLLDFLDERKLRDDTLVIYVTDNGWIQDPNGNNYAPKSKQSPNEFGLRTPISLRLPGRIKPRMPDDFANSIDLAPTILKACGLSPTADMQGIDLLDESAVAARKQIFGEIFTHNAIDVHNPASNLRYRWTRTDKWKLILPNGANEPQAVVQLYDVEADPHETNNLAEAHGEVVAQLSKDIDAWWTPKAKTVAKQVSMQKAAKPATGEAEAPPLPQWIWAAEPAPQPDRERVWLRKKFTLKPGFSSARLYISGDDGINVYLDGQDVTTSDSWQTPVFKDVTKLLSPKENADGGGEHVLAIEARNDAGAAGVIVQLDVEPFRGQTTHIVSDDTWRAVHGPADGEWKRSGYDEAKWPRAASVAPLGGGPWATAVTVKSFTAAAKLREPTATSIADMKIAKDFKVELLYTVPKEVEGSWVCMCLDPKGRMIVCDQYGGLYRLTLPPLDKTAAPQIEKIDVPIGEAQGLLWAFDSLYVNVNKGSKYEHGLYRVRDTDGDDKLDTVESLRKLTGGGEHGPHAVLAHPDGKSLYVVIGNQTKLTEITDSRVPLNWGEDHLLPRMPDGRGFMRGVLAPGGCIYRIDPDGKNWELVATGFRNQYDMALNHEGEMFTYDADMEWDINTPWYRPTRVNHVLSGGEYGWRNGAGKWPDYYPDSFGAVVNVGPGSPTGVTFGYGAKFPAKYQEALFICDWSYGKLYATHLTPNGASYMGQLEEFITGTPLPLTDLLVNPHDGALYFAIGGRKTQSGLYRVTYTGSEPTGPVRLEPDLGSALREQRRKLETLHKPDATAVATAWPFLGHEDRALRYAARVAIEHQPVKEWQAKALAETNQRAAIHALLALVRASAVCPQHRQADTPWPDAELGTAILKALERIEWQKLSRDEQVDYLRVHAVLFNRFGPPVEADAARVAAHFDSAFLAEDRRVNAELCNLLVYLQAPPVAAKAVAMLESAPTQEEQIEYARRLRMLRAGWTPELRKTYFEWFVKAGGYKGGSSFALFVQGIKSDAVATLTGAELKELKPLIDAKSVAATGPLVVGPPRAVVKKWTMDEVLQLTPSGLKDRNFNRGRQMFAAANCFACHRFDSEGGAVGPDLSSLAGRFSVRDILESILDPSKVISDQYAAVTVVTSDGRIITGRIINLAGDALKINTNMLDPQAIENVDRKSVEEQFPSKASMMPTGLLDVLHEDELLDLLAYLLSRGDRKHAMFQKTTAGK